MVKVCGDGEGGSGAEVAVKVPESRLLARQ